MQKKKEFVGEKNNNWQMFVTKKDNILNWLEREGVWKKKEYIGGLKWGFNRKKICKNTLCNFAVNILKRHLKGNRGSI